MSRDPTTRPNKSNVQLMCPHKMPPRLLPRGHDLPTSIEECLHMVSDIIQKYNDAEEGEEPQEGDYLKAMDLLKRINDLRIGAGVSHNQQNRIQTVTRVVIQWRERDTVHPSPSRVALSAVQEMEKKANYLLCPFCSTLVKDSYAMVRHTKRPSCKTAAIIKAIKPVSHLLMERVNLRNENTDLRLPFLVTLSFIFLRAEPCIRRPKPDGSVPTWYGKPFPQRLLPRRLWNSIWDPRGYFLDNEMKCPRDPTRMLVYTPNMFCGKIYVRPYMERHTLANSPWLDLRFISPFHTPSVLSSSFNFETYQRAMANPNGKHPWNFVMSIDVENEERERDAGGWI